MDGIITKKKARRIEAEPSGIKGFLPKELSLDIDEENWEKVSLNLKKIRKRNFKKLYGGQ